MIMLRLQRGHPTGQLAGQDPQQHRTGSYDGSTVSELVP